MALYADYEMPEGIDVVFNTNKTRAQADIVFKPAKKDPNNPFGALLRNEGGQYTYEDKDGNTKLGLINKTRHRCQETRIRGIDILDQSYGQEETA